MYLEIHNSDDDNVLFRYSDNFKYNRDCRKCFDSNKNVSELKKCYFHVEESNSCKYFFCFPKEQVKNTNHIKMYSLFAIQIYESLQNNNPLRDSMPRDTPQEAYSEVLRTSFHNTKSIATNIREKIFSLFEIDEEEFANMKEDKISYMCTIIQRKEYNTARELLSILKSTEQIIHEFTNIDFLNPKVKLSSKQMGIHKVHHIYVLSFYMYERDFLDKRIYINTGKCDDRIFINYLTAKTAIAQILDNTLKYAKPNSSVDVTFSSQTIDDVPYIAMTFKMTSLAIRRNEIPILIQQGQRSPYANKAQIPGSGKGLFIVKRMMELNDGFFSIETDDNVQKHKGIPYTNNTFTLYFKKC